MHTQSNLLLVNSIIHLIVDPGSDTYQSMASVVSNGRAVREYLYFYFHPSSINSPASFY